MKFIIGDIETYLEYFLCVFYLPEGDKWYKFEVNKWTDELNLFVEFIETHEEYYFVFYNGLRFDTQVIEFIIRNHKSWESLSQLDICSIIHQNANDTISDANFGLLPKYRETSLSFKTLDPFEILHFSNKNRLIGLKQLEFELDLQNIELIPIAPDKRDLTKDEIIQIWDYCKNDTYALYELLLVVLGETSHPLYKGNNQLELRQNIEEEFGIKCLNFSDSKIGDEIVKKYYCQEKNIDYTDLPKKGFFRKNIYAKNCIAKYIEFKTPELQKFLLVLKNKSFGLKDEFKEVIHFYGNNYSFMKGGLHTEQQPQIFHATDEKLIIDYDVSSYYPAIIINNKQYPFHLGKEFLTGYRKLYEKRLELKPLSKENKKIKGIVDALKLSVNSVYGKSSDVQSWIYDKQLTLFTTLTGELSLMMLIEAYELAGIKVISANTDGVTIYTEKTNIQKVEEINNWWMGLTNYELEKTDYSSIYFLSVNDYIAIKTSGDVKKKGDMCTDFELYKNKSARIVPLALEQYFVNHIPVEQTIKSHTNIYDFCIRQKASKDFHYEGISKNGKNVYNKLIRYYVANEGEKLLKIKNPTCETNAAPVSQVEAGEWKCFVCNKLSKDHPSTNINFSYYIEKAEKIIAKVEGKKTVKAISNQLSLFG